MHRVLPLVAVGFGLLLTGWLYMRLWRWRCPACGQRRLRWVGTASEWSAELVERRFWEARCRACGRHAVQRSGPFGRWTPARHAEPAVAPAGAGRGGSSE